MHIYTYRYAHAHTWKYTQISWPKSPLRYASQAISLWLCCSYAEFLVMPPHLDQEGTHKLCENEGYKAHCLCERRTGIDSLGCPGKHGQLKSHSPSKWEKLTRQRMAGVYRHPAPKYKSFRAESRRFLLSVIWGSRSVQRASRFTKC